MVWESECAEWNNQSTFLFDRYCLYLSYLSAWITITNPRSPHRWALDQNEQRSHRDSCEHNTTSPLFFRWSDISFNKVATRCFDSMRTILHYENLKSPFYRRNILKWKWTAFLNILIVVLTHFIDITTTHTYKNKSKLPSNWYDFDSHSQFIA